MKESKAEELSRIVQNQSWGFQEMKQLAFKLERENAAFRAVCRMENANILEVAAMVADSNHAAKTAEALRVIASEMKATLKPHSP